MGRMGRMGRMEGTRHKFAICRLMLWVGPPQSGVALRLPPQSMELAGERWPQWFQDRQRTSQAFGDGNDEVPPIQGGGNTGCTVPGPPPGYNMAGLQPEGILQRYDIGVLPKGKTGKTGI